MDFGFNLSRTNATLYQSKIQFVPNVSLLPDQTTWGYKVQVRGRVAGRQQGEARVEVRAEGLESSRGMGGSCWGVGGRQGTLAAVYSYVKAASSPPSVGPTQNTCP